MSKKSESIVTVKLFCVHYNECDPKKCTALKLKKFNLIKIVKKIDGALSKAIILNPFSSKEISINDRAIISDYGIIVIDCSWNKTLDFNQFNQENSRRLPSLIAANPTNYGKWEKLSSAEALAAALFITNFVDDSRLILSKFSWGEEFFKINSENF